MTEQRKQPNLPAWLLSEDEKKIERALDKELNLSPLLNEILAETEKADRDKRGIAPPVPVAPKQSTPEPAPAPPVKATPSIEAMMTAQNNWQSEEYRKKQERRAKFLSLMKRGKELAKQMRQPLATIPFPAAISSNDKRPTKREIFLRNMALGKAKKRELKKNTLPSGRRRRVITFCRQCGYFLCRGTARDYVTIVFDEKFNAETNTWIKVGVSGGHQATQADLDAQRRQSKKEGNYSQRRDHGVISDKKKLVEDGDRQRFAREIHAA